MLAKLIAHGSDRETARRKLVYGLRSLFAPGVQTNREFLIRALEHSERAELQDAVAFLDRRMREIRDGGKVAGADRIAVMAALNIAHELLRARAQAGAPNATPGKARAAIDDAAARRRIGAMQSAIDEALAGAERPS